MKGGDGIRTHEYRFCKPTPKTRKHLTNKELKETTKGDYDRSYDHGAHETTRKQPEIDADLSLIIEAWDKIPGHIKQTIKNLLTVSGTDK